VKLYVVKRYSWMSILSCFPRCLSMIVNRQFAQREFARENSEQTSSPIAISAQRAHDLVRSHAGFATRPISEAMIVSPGGLFENVVEHLVYLSRVEIPRRNLRRWDREMQSLVRHPWHGAAPGQSNQASLCRIAR